MKTECGSFTPSTSGVTLVLDDDSLVVKGVFFQICKNGTNINGSTGFDDSIKHRAKYCLRDTIEDSGRTTSYSMYHKKNSGGVATVAVAGKVITNGFANAGEVGMSFDTADTSYSVEFMVVGD